MVSIDIFQDPFFLQAAAAGVIVISGIIIAHFFSKIVGIIIRKFELAGELKGKRKKPEFYIENGTGRQVTAGEEIRIVEEPDKAGLVHAGADT